MPQALVGLIVAAGVPGLVTAAGTLTLAGTLTSFAIGVGLSLAGSALLAAAQKTPKPQDVQNTLRQPVPPRMRYYGRHRVGGSLMAIETWQGNLYQVIAHSQGLLDGVEGYIIDNRSVTTDSSGNVTSRPYPRTVSVGNPVRVRCVTYPGTASQLADPDMMTRFPDLWTEYHRLRGVCYTVFTAARVKSEYFINVYPTGIPKLNVDARFSRVFDPRDPTQSRSDQSTWKYTTNLALQFADYLTHPDGMQIDWSMIDEDRLSTAADVCDEVLTTKSGSSVLRYHGGLSYSLTSEPREVVDRFLFSMDGRLSLLPSGKIAVDAGKWVEPVVHVEDRHICSFELTDSSGPLSEANEIIIKYTFEEANFSETTCDPWRDDDLISQYGEVKTKDFEAFEIRSHNHARRIAKILSERLSPRWSGTIVTNLFGMKCYDQRWILLSIDSLGIEAETFEILSFTESFLDGRVVMEVASFREEIYNFDPATEEGTAPTAPELLEESDVTPPEGIEAETVLVTGGYSVIRVSWDAQRNDYSVQVQYAIANSGQWQAVAVSDNSTSVDIYSLIDGEEYDVQVRNIAASGTPSTWVTLEDIQYIGNPSPPGSPTSLSVSSSGADVVVTWITPNSQSFSRSRLYRAPAGSPLGSAADISGSLFGSPNQSVTYIDSPPYGSYDYWVVAENASGVQSSPTGPVSLSGGVQPETSALLARMTVQPSSARRNLIDELISSLKSAGVWSKLNTLYVYAAHSQQASLLNWRSSSYDSSALGSPVFTADRGFALSSGSSIDTTMNPSTAGAPYTQNSAHFGLWSRTSGQFTGYELGSTASAASNYSYVRLRSTSDTLGARINDLTALTVTGVTDASGHTVVNRSGATARQVFKNGVQVFSDSVASSGLTNSSTHVGRMSTTYTDRQIAAAHTGGSLTAGEADALYDALYTYMSAVGAA